MDHFFVVCVCECAGWARQDAESRRVSVAFVFVNDLWVFVCVGCTGMYVRMYVCMCVVHSLTSEQEHQQHMKKSNNQNSAPKKSCL